MLLQGIKDDRLPLRTEDGLKGKHTGKNTLSDGLHYSRQEGKCQTQNSPIAVERCTRNI